MRQGALEAKTPRALAAECDVVILCVTGSPEVKQVRGCRRFFHAIPASARRHSRCYRSSVLESRDVRKLLA
jgi:3-hydroxyisobutyrate dehydrogenase-like beta-hydroxyacid dehydrogenase